MPDAQHIRGSRFPRPVHAVVGVVMGVAVASLPAAAWGMADPAYPPLFGTKEVRSTNLAPFPKWTGVLDRYFAEARRVLKPEGRLVLSTHGNYRQHAEVDFWRWTPPGMRACLEDHGFEVEALVPILSSSSAVLLFLWGDLVLQPMTKWPLIGRPLKVLHLPMNLLILMIESRARADETLFPYILLSTARKSAPCLTNPPRESSLVG